MGCADRRQFLRRVRGFQVRLQFADNQLGSSAPKPSVLGAPPAIGIVRTATDRCGRKVFADMEEVAEETTFVSKDLIALQGDPTGPVGHAVNVALQSPTRRFDAMAPTTPHLIDVPESGCVECLHAVLGLRRRQTYFPPLPRAFARPFARVYGANHGTVDFGDHAISALCRQGSVVACIVFA